MNTRKMLSILSTRNACLINLICISMGNVTRVYFWYMNVLYIYTQIHKTNLKSIAFLLEQ